MTPHDFSTDLGLSTPAAAPRQPGAGWESKSSRRKRLRGPRISGDFAIAELQLMLGAAYAREGRFSDSKNAFEAALQEGAGWEHTALADFAEEALKSGAQDVAVRAQLELALRHVKRGHDPILRSLGLLDEKVIDSYGQWITDSWFDEIDRRAPKHVKGIAALLAGTVSMLRAEHAEALKFFSLVPKPLPALQRRDAMRLAAKADAEPLALARACVQLGLIDEALEQLRLAIADGSDDQEIEARELQVRLQEMRRRNADLSLALLALGRAYDRRTRHREAVATYERLTTLFPRDPRGWWYLADSRRLDAGLTEDVQRGTAELKLARREWRNGMERGLPTEKQAWVHLSGAMIIENIGAIEDPTGDALWDAALQVERSLALNPGNDEAWTQAARLHRLLGNAAYAIACAEGAVFFGGESRARIEQIATRLSACDPQATSLIRAARGRVPGYEDVLGSLLGFAQLLAGDLDDAAESLEAALSRDRGDVWSRANRMALNVLRSDQALAGEDAREVLELTASPTGSPSVDDYLVRATALVVLERYDDAVPSLQPLVGTTWCDAVEAAAVLAVTESLRGDDQAADRWMRHFSANATFVAQACMTSWLVDLAAERGAEVEGIRHQHAETLRQLQARRYDAAAGFEELSQIRARSAEGSAGWLAVTVALARSAEAEGALTDAQQYFESLVSHSHPIDGVPEGRSGLIRVLQRRCRDGDPSLVAELQDRLVALGAATEAQASTAVAEAHSRIGEFGTALASLSDVDARGLTADVRTAQTRRGDIFLATGDAREARRAYTGALESAQLHGDDETELARISARLALVEAQEDRILEADARLRSLVVDYHDPQARGVTERIVMGAAHEVIGLDPATTPWLPAVLRAVAASPADLSPRTPPFPPLRRRRLSAARFSLLRAQPSAGPARVTPILLETAPDLLDVDERAQLAHSIPRLRKRVLIETGVRVSGVVTRSTDLLGGRAYRLLLEEIPRLSGTVPYGARFARPPMTTAHKIGDVRGPFTGRSAAWTVETTGTEQMPPADGILWQLEGLLRLHLARFIGLAEVDYLLDEWEGEVEGRAEVIARVLPNKDSRVLLTGVLRALVRGHVPVNDVEAILWSLDGAARRPFFASVERARDALHRAFPRIVDGRELLHVPDSLLDTIRSAPIELWSLLHEFLAGERPGGVVLVVSDPELRAVAQAAFERVWPSAAVLSARELPSSPLNSMTHQAR